jgi:hypothetical protein
MKIWKIVSGIINCIFFIFSLTVLASIATGAAPERYYNYSFMSLVGIAFCLLVGGITSIVSSGSRSMAANIVLSLLYLPIAIISFYNKFLLWMLWGGICFIVPWIYAQMIRQKKIVPAVPRQPQQPQQQFYQPPQQPQPQKPKPKYQGAPKGSISSIAHAKLDDK